MRQSIKTLTKLQHGAELHWVKQNIVRLRDSRFFEAKNEFQNISNRLRDVPVEEFTLSSRDVVIRVVRDIEKRMERT